MAQMNIVLQDQTVMPSTWPEEKTRYGEMGVGDFGPVLHKPMDVGRHIALSLTLHPIEHPLGDPYSKSR